ncbi:39S ribosomal protein L18, mitochondrial-like [Dreissena polymorpha]|uniref:Large ribosomal subunit protein uL18m n=1 Tax=Dreissena polymorpha TaxID=45954 RepID=A0A9D4N1V9_DREPO|nr:39S ribosomal protein L18, mitochondrial-like [Dreissena polymorpha]KAH3885789.1 hypothetical protein DPMN_009787 [Dreissena polymorpha]
MALFRLISPYFVDGSQLSCRTLLSLTVSRCYCDSQVKANSDIKANPLFENRNPRALERMGIARKVQGWKFQAPRKDFYHKLVYDKTKMTAHVVHSSGKIVIEASTKEPAVLKYLYKHNDVSASWNLGQLLARRMLESGITEVFYDAENKVTEDEAEGSKPSEKIEAFFSALKDNAIKLSEPDPVKFETVPGINYEGYTRLGERKKYQEDYQKL